MKTNRRRFITLVGGGCGLAGLAGGLPGAFRAAAAETEVDLGAIPPRILSPPDEVTIETADATLTATRSGEEWTAEDVVVQTRQARSVRLVIKVASPTKELKRIRLLWRLRLPAAALVLGDHWERGYGDLAWAAVNPARVLPWYALVSDSRRACGFGVMTQPASMCWWSVGHEEIALVCDLRSGPLPVKLGKRVLEAATVVSLATPRNAPPFETATRLCRAMCPEPLLPPEPVYGFNDWYYALGKNSADNIARDAALLAEVSEGLKVRPFCLVDGGWQPGGDCPGGPWHAGNDKFPDMAGLAAHLKGMNVRPGLWIRLLLTSERVPERWLRPPSPNLLDPSQQEVLDFISSAVRRAVNEWGYELIKHDFSAYDVFGLWGREMRERIFGEKAPPFSDRSRTTAEIILAFHRAVRTAAGSALIIGCNTVSHLSAGIFHMQRVGDDSGGDWTRARDVGINAFAYRMPQHGAFYAADPDCIGITGKTPWNLNSQWLDLMSRSGVPLFISAEPSQVTPEIKTAMREAFARAIRPKPSPEPLDWIETRSPTRWRCQLERKIYDWSEKT